jgi:hypothetical protein
MSTKRELIAINHLGEHPVPIIEFARDLDKAEIVISLHASSENPEKRLLMFSKLKGKAKVGDTINLVKGQELIGLLFNNDESIDVVIRKLQELKEMKE